MLNLEIVTDQNPGKGIPSFTSQELQNKSQETIDKLKNAARQGFFYCEIPENCRDFIPAAKEFANKFYGDESITLRPHIGWTGYHKKGDQQKEALFVERAEWKNWYSEEIITLANRMHTLFLTIIENLLTACEIPQEKWEMATGGAFEGKGMHHFSFNHYRPEENKPGLNPHRDFGLLTLLFIDKGGLEALIDDEWRPVFPKENYFVVNVSRALEVFVNNKEKVNAAWHKVIKVNEDRVSFGLFSDHELDRPVFKQEQDGTISIAYQTYKQLAEECFTETYSGDSICYVEK